MGEEEMKKEGKKEKWKKNPNLKPVTVFKILFKMRTIRKAG